MLRGYRYRTRVRRFHAQQTFASEGCVPLKCVVEIARKAGLIWPPPPAGLTVDLLYHEL
jgi:hypothetical protein